jgi:hypothetical protein
MELILFFDKVIIKGKIQSKIYRGSHGSIQILHLLRGTFESNNKKNKNILQ